MSHGGNRVNRSLRTYYSRRFRPMTKSVWSRDGLARGAATVITMYAGTSRVCQRMVLSTTKSLGSHGNRG